MTSRSASELPGDGLVEAEAESVGCDDEEDVTLPTVSLFDPHVPDVEACRFNLSLGTIDVGHMDRGAVLRRVAAGEREPDPDAIPLEDHRLVRLVPPLHLPQTERVAVPLRCGIEVGHGKGQHVLLVGERLFEQRTVRHLETSNRRQLHARRYYWSAKLRATRRSRRSMTVRRARTSQHTMATPERIAGMG